MSPPTPPRENPQNPSLSSSSTINEMGEFANLERPNTSPENDDFADIAEKIKPYKSQWHYFYGPHRLDKHSKLPIFMRLSGSVMPRMIVPMIFMCCWTMTITSIHMWVHSLGVSNILMTVLGYIISVSLSMRMNSAYERYTEGRRAWATLREASRTLARCIWLFTDERQGEDGKDDVIAKLSGINLILAFNVALKHKLRFEPNVSYDDLHGLISHLDTFAAVAEERTGGFPLKPSISIWKQVGQSLRIPFAMSNPRKAIKKAQMPLGNLPLEILNHLSSYVSAICTEGSMPLAGQHAQAFTALSRMEDAMTATERILNTPLPIAYAILIDQVTWIYALMLPFQLLPVLKWVTIPASIIATYIIHGLVSICAEIENPFGDDVNDLPLDMFCQQLASDLFIMTSAPPPDPNEIFSRDGNKVLYPLSNQTATEWRQRTMSEIRAALRTKVTALPNLDHLISAPSATKAVADRLRRRPGRSDSSHENDTGGDV